MPRRATLLLALLLLPLTAGAAGAAEYPVTVAGSLGAAGGPPSAGGYAGARVLFHLGRFGFEGIGREGLVSGDLRTIGGIHFGLRYRFAGPAYLRGGFVHHHETPWELMREAPIRSLAGTAEGIRHRSGADLGLGVLVPFQGDLLGDRFGWMVELSVAAFPDPLGPTVYVFLEQGFTFGIGPRHAVEP